MAEEAGTRAKTTVAKDSVFRGTWQPTIYKPVFGAYQFLPTPMPQEPRKKQAEVQEAPPVELPAATEVRERLRGKELVRGET